MTREQFDALNVGLSSAHTLLISRIAECKAKGYDADMYYRWKQENEVAFQALREVFIKASVSREAFKTGVSN